MSTDDDTEALLMLARRQMEACADAAKGVDRGLTRESPIWTQAYDDIRALRRAASEVLIDHHAMTGNADVSHKPVTSWVKPDGSLRIEQHALAHLLGDHHMGVGVVFHATGPGRLEILTNEAHLASMGWDPGDGDDDEEPQAATEAIVVSRSEFNLDRAAFIAKASPSQRVVVVDDQTKEVAAAFGGSLAGEGRMESYPLLAREYLTFYKPNEDEG